MGEREAVERVDRPVTVESMVADLRQLGVEAGDTLIVHTAMSALGWVCAGPDAVVDALRRVVTDRGTLVLPTHTGQYSDPSAWSNPPVPDDWVPEIAASIPPYRPAVTPTRLGAVPETFRSYPDVVRSRHPEFSFAAWGADADAVVAGHGYDRGLGEESPLARVYDREGRVLLLGVGHGVNTSLHLAEYRADIEVPTLERSAPVLRAGDRTVVDYEDIEKDTDDFPAIGEAFAESVGLDDGVGVDPEDGRLLVSEGRVGAAESTLIDQPALVDFAVDWMAEHRD